MSHSAQIHRVLARCIVDADFLQRVQMDAASTLLPYGLDDDAVLDFQSLAPRIAQYAGLITNIQNNGLWQYIPATRLLLKRYGLDLKAFIAFRSQHQLNRMRNGAQRDAVTETFFAFLQDLLDCDPTFARPLLKLVFAHEHTVWNMERMKQPAAMLPIPRASIENSLVPVIHGALWITHYEADPIVTIERIRAGMPDATGPEPTTIGYWRDPNGNTLRIIGLTPSAAALLANVDGRSSVDTLVARTVEEQGADTAAIWLFLKHCFAIGLLAGSATPVAERNT